MTTTSKIRISLALVATLGLAACDENGEFAFPGPKDSAATDSANPILPAPPKLIEQDVEKPDVFEANGLALWDGRPSLGGIWVAHPNVVDPERVIIRNTQNGRSVVGALFRRERDNPGPAIQVSSDAAEELGMLAGAPTDLSIIALRREEVAVEPVIEERAPDEPIDEEATDLAVPAAIAATPLDPIANASAAIDAAEAASAPVAAGAAAAGAVAVATAAALPDAAAVEVQVDPPVIEASTSPEAFIQIGIFSVEANVNGAADRLRAEGIETSVIAQNLGGNSVWRVVAGPADEADRAEALSKINELGFIDAFFVKS